MSDLVRGCTVFECVKKKKNVLMHSNDNYNLLIVFVQSLFSLPPPPPPRFFRRPNHKLNGMVDDTRLA